MSAEIWKANGEVVEATPLNGTDFTLSEMQEIVGGYIQLQTLASGKRIVINEEGKLHNFDKNEKASAQWSLVGMPGDYIVGDVLVCDPTYIK